MMKRGPRNFLISVIVLLLMLFIAAILLFPNAAREDVEPADIEVSEAANTEALLITAPPVTELEQPEYQTLTNETKAKDTHAESSDTTESDSETAPSKHEPVKPSVDLSTPWYEQYPVVAHALGTVEGRTETNSREAFMESYEAGQRVFEVDLFLTSDNHLVARHDFLDNSYYNLEQEKPPEMTMDYDSYMSSIIKYKYTPLDIDGVLELLVEYPDTYIITDSKETEHDPVTLEFKLLAEAVERIDPKLKNRIIVQIYHDDMYDYVSKVYDCKNWIYTLYQLPERDYKKIGAFCFMHNINVVTMSYDLFSVESLKTLHTYQTRVYLHTVNRLMTMLDYISCGIDGFYSDYITTPDLRLALSVDK